MTAALLSSLPQVARDPELYGMRQKSNVLSTVQSQMRGSELLAAVEPLDKNC